MIPTLTFANGSELAALVIAFRREESLARSFSVLHESGVRRIYLALDGPRDSSDIAIHNNILAFSQKFCTERNIQLQIWRRTENYGLSLSILTALDWVFKNEEYVVVIEDDLEFDIDFVQFVWKSLSAYESDDDVWLVSGSRFESFITKESTISWSTYPMIWGWASWSSRWPRMKSAILMSEIQKSKRFSFRSYFFWKTGLRRVNLGILNSWAVPLAAVMHDRNGFCLLPPVNLVSNIGVDNHAEHTTKPSWHSNVARKLMPTPIDFDTDNRELIAVTTDHFFENKIFNISIINIFSYLSSLLLDKFRFPVKTRVDPLSVRFKNVKLD